MNGISVATAYILVPIDNDTSVVRQRDFEASYMSCEVSG
jgi:hypothetical protein